MARRGGAVHVATTTRIYGGRVYKSHLLRRTFREGSKVRHETVGNLSHLPDPVIELIRKALRGEILVAAGEMFAIERSLPHGHVAAVLGTLRKLGLDRMLGSPCRELDLTVAMIVARVLDPRSKLATARGLDETSSLGQVLSLGKADEDELYAAMDWLAGRQARVEARLAKAHLSGGALVLYDLTSVYFEGRSCPLAHMGYSRDGRSDRPQIELGLMTDAEGRPVAVEVFAGNMGDPTTLRVQVEKLQGRFGLQRVILVGDRGMITEARIREELQPHGLAWITSLRAPAIRKLVESGSLQMSLFDQRDLGEITAPAYPDERLIVCRNPLLAEERARKRQELLAATESELAAIVAATQRERAPLRGKDKIGVRVGKVLQRFKVGKHFRTEIGEQSFRYARDEQLIAAEAALDGIYVLRTNVPKHELDTEPTVEAYKSLSLVERAFRSFKTVDLKVRPIHHHLETRVRAHVFLCMLAYYVEWHMRERLAPLLFDDEDPAAGKRRRSSVIAPAQRSVSAEDKASHKTTADGLPVHSFRTLLAALGTLCLNRVLPKVDNPVPFDQYTLPTPLQRRALDLLQVSPRM